MSGIGSGISSIFGGIGDLAAAGDYSKAAKLAEQNAHIAKVSTDIQEAQQRRQQYQIIGGVEAAAGANNLSLSGSAMDVMRSNIQQITLNKSLVGEQGLIEQNAWKEKAAADQAMAAASQAAGIGGILGGVASIFGL